MATSCPAAYRARKPRATPLYRLFEHHFEEVRGQWEERFERRFGFWRGIVDEQVCRYLDCGLYENGFARISCPDYAEEYLLAFSCKTRELCPSCAAKRSAAMAALLSEERSELLLSWRHTGFSVRAKKDQGLDARALRRSWAKLIKRIYEADPLVCPSCGGEMKVVAFIIEHEVVDKILRHLTRREEEGRGRGPPGQSEFAAAW